MNYYDENAKVFIEMSQKVDMSAIYDEFIPLIKTNGHILDIGCGSGRDAKYFIDKGYNVSALEPSKELARFTQKNTGINVHRCNLNDFETNEKYDAIWACASLLHIPKSQMPKALVKIKSLLIPGGFAYISWKFGKNDGIRDGRYYSDYQLEEMKNLLQQNKIDLHKCWLSDEDRDGETIKWLNVIIKK